MPTYTYDSSSTDANVVKLRTGQTGTTAATRALSDEDIAIIIAGVETTIAAAIPWAAARDALIAIQAKFATLSQGVSEETVSKLKVVYKGSGTSENEMIQELITFYAKRAADESVSTSVPRMMRVISGRYTTGRVSRD